MRPFVGFGYQHDNDAEKGKASATFATKLEKAGGYSIRIAYPMNTNRASNVSVEVITRSGKKSLLFDQRKTPSHEPFHDLGTYSLGAGEESSVIIRNADSDGYVIIDAVQWLPVE